MNPGDTFNTQASQAILLLGESGTGKSSLAMRFPDPGFMLGDKNIKHAATWAAERKMSWFWADPLLDDKGQPAPDPWTRSMAILKEMGADPNVKTIVDDGLTHLTGYLKQALIQAGSAAEKPLVIGGEKVMTMSLWGPFADNLRRRITIARSFGKPYIMIAHLSSGENEMTGSKEYQVALQGAMRDEIRSWFSDVWLCDAVPDSNAKYAGTRGIRYYVRTAASHRIKLKCSDATMPAEIDVEALAERMNLRK